MQPNTQQQRVPFDYAPTSEFAHLHVEMRATA